MKWSNQLKMFLGLINDLKNQHYKVSVLSNKYSVEKRTMYRYFQVLRDSGYKVKKDSKGYFYI